MYTRAFTTLGCSDLSLDDAIALGKRHGIEQLELRALGGTLDLPAYFAEKFHTPAELHGHILSSGARFVVLDTSFRVIDGSLADRAKLLEFVPWAEALGARWLRVFDGGTALDAAALATAADTMKWWGAMRRETGFNVGLLIETHDLLLDAARIQQFVAALPRDSVRLLWDTHHTWKKGGEDPLTTWKSIRPHVSHLHVKDSVSRPSAKHPYTYVLPGTGEFPMARLRNILANEFSGGLSLEWEKLWHPYLPSLDDALRSAGTHAWW